MSNYIFTLSDGLIYEYDDMGTPVVIEPARPIPEVPPPVWDSRPIDPGRCVAATKALCG
jgi:hypothetical protein